MANELVPGDDTCPASTMGGEIFEAWEAFIAGLIPVPDISTISPGIKRFVGSVAIGVVGHMVSAITDGKFLRVIGGKVVGADAGGGAPDPHGATHASNGSDPIPAATTLVRGTVELATNGENAAGVVVQGNDSRLSDNRNPLSHAASHGPLGGDQLKLDDLAEPEDTTDLNSDTTRHGLLRKLSGVSTQFLNGAGNWVSGSGIDSDAFHSSTSGEFSALTSKTELAQDDSIPLESTSNDNAKRVTTVQAIHEARARTIYEVNFASLGTQVIANGSNVIDGKTWTAANVGQATTFQVFNGTGLEIVAQSGTSNVWSTTTQTAPALHILLDDLSTDAARYDRQLLVWLYFSAYSLPQNGNAALALLESPTGGPYSATVVGSGLMNSSSTVGPCGVSSASLTINSDTALVNTNVVVLRAETTRQIAFSGGEWSAGWPTWGYGSGKLKTIGAYNDTNGITVAVIPRRAATRLVIACATRNTVGAPSLTLERLRLQLM